MMGELGGNTCKPKEIMQVTKLVLQIMEILSVVMFVKGKL